MKVDRIVKLLVVFVVMTMFTSSCYYDQILEAPPTPVTGPVSFTKDVIPIFNASCNTSGCHDGQVAPNLRPDKAYNALQTGGYIDVAMPENSELFQWMKGNRSLPMPLSGANENYNNVVYAWIVQGALDN